MGSGVRNSLFLPSLQVNFFRWERSTTGHSPTCAKSMETFSLDGLLRHSGIHLMGKCHRRGTRGNGQACMLLAVSAVGFCFTPSDLADLV